MFIAFLLTWTVAALWFWNARTSSLAIADYNGDNRPDFNLGQYTNNTKSAFRCSSEPDSR